MNPQLRAWQDRVNRRCADIEAALPAKAEAIEYDFTTGAERVTLRQPGASIPEPPRAQPGSFNDDSAVIAFTQALAALDDDLLDSYPPTHATVRLDAYRDAGLGPLVKDLARRGRLDMIDRNACRAERIRRSVIERTILEMPPAAVEAVDHVVLAGAKRFIAAPWRLDRLRGGLHHDSLADMPIDKLRIFIEGRLLGEIGYLERHPDMATMDGAGFRVTALRQALHAVKIVKAAGGWNEALAAQEAA